MRSRPTHALKALLWVSAFSALGCGGLADLVDRVTGSSETTQTASATPSAPISPSFAEDGGLSTKAKYGPQQLIDGNPHTSWCVVGSAAVKLHFTGSPTLTELQFLNGRQKVTSDRYGDRFYYNHRAATVELTFSNGHRMTANLPDSKSWQSVKVGAQSAQWVQVAIKSSHYGTGRKPQNCISDIIVLGG